METIKDPVFGEMTFRYGWNKNQKMHFWCQNVTLKITASAYKGEGITDNQRMSYQEFLDDVDNVSHKSLWALKQYIVQNQLVDLEPSQEVDFEEITELAFPKTVVFEGDGSVGILCECTWDPEHGVVIQLPSYDVGPQDVFL